MGFNLLVTDPGFERWFPQPSLLVALGKHIANHVRKAVRREALMISGAILKRRALLPRTSSAEYALVKSQAGVQAPVGVVMTWC